IEALVLGSRWVSDRADGRLALAARDALAKILAVLPGDLRDDAEASALLVGPGAAIMAESFDLSAIRKAIRSERKLSILYRDGVGQASERVVWPFALSFFDHVRVVVAWCELRQDFRHFRTDRISQVQPLDIRYPRRRQGLLKEWREREGIPQPS
ncbi:helix-turn-helix transcriptional regulator, partial [Lysobacter sp. TAB13]|uniref:helix-turn-helix transcriptional regulator n=1 Tax=Lysobacter sp. TAB13 TaxID=3233065 RepID=UPI003F9C5452